jgi:hemerythrin-like domain-containing protein
MSQDQPIPRLEREHRAIQKVVAAMVELADQVDTGREIKREAMGDIVEFMRGFASGIHEQKEESLLFPLLEKRGISVRSCPVRMLVHEHQLGRSLIEGLVSNFDAYQAGDHEAGNRLVESLRRLADLYPLHIWREDMLLFPRATRVLSKEDNSQLMEDFQATEEDGGGNALARYEALADQIEERMR